MIEIVHSKTGEFKHMADMQAVSDFLAGREDARHWTGFAHLGELPPPTNATVAREAKPVPAQKPAVKKAPVKTTPKAPAKKAARRR